MELFRSRCLMEDVSPGSQASAPAYYGPDAGGHSSPDAQEQVSDKHRRIPKARLPHPVLTDTLLAQPHTQEAKLPRSASKWTLLVCYASGHSAAVSADIKRNRNLPRNNPRKSGQNIADETNME
ncbi:hypothetical protein CEXT_461871 [Caerostris extrusa]|uniref:Uncharacterized protein n=1 Tax=Caerostris extrusa TaxID=172846 RepID=A0AAV4VPI2_CAEEX|nr:hypothetical protein CEXT_461871 [Caerostris extrusa]